MSTKTIQTNKKGFTIIEVVLVLAIAGLIFLMVFVALPALQRNQRDTQRRNDMSRLITAVTSYQANNSNNIPVTATGLDANFLSDYLKQNSDINLSEFKDPSNVNYTVNPIALSSGGTGSAGSNPEIRLYTNAYCAGETPTFRSGSGNIAVVYDLEGSGAVCVDNN